MKYIKQLNIDFNNWDELSNRNNNIIWYIGIDDTYYITKYNIQREEMYYYDNLTDVYNNDVSPEDCEGNYKPHIESIPLKEILYNINRSITDNNIKNHVEYYDKNFIFITHKNKITKYDFIAKSNEIDNFFDVFDIGFDFLHLLK